MYTRDRHSLPAAGPEDFHEWRKRAKYHWYARRLLREVWPATMDARRGEVRRLSGLLGAEHDPSVYRQTLESEPEPGVTATRLPEIPAAADKGGPRCAG